MTVRSAVWRDQLTPEERVALGRGDGQLTITRPDILVVGGGIMGVAIAAACNEIGLGSVLLIDTGRLGSGATGGATGLLIPEPHVWSDAEPFVDLERASLERWRDLEKALPEGVGLTEVDWLGLAPHDSGFAAHQPRAVEWLNPGQVGELIPGLRFRIGGRACDLDHRLDGGPLRIEIDRSHTGYTRNWPAYLSRRWKLRADAYSRFVESVVRSEERRVGKEC